MNGSSGNVLSLCTTVVLVPQQQWCAHSITPCAFDQFQHARLANSNGVGVGMPQFSKVTVASLAAALNKCINDKRMIARAQDLAKKLKLEEGERQAVSVIDEFIVNEVNTGAYNTKFKKRVQEMNHLRNKKPFNCLTWTCRMLCSLTPNDYSVRLHGTKNLHGTPQRSGPVLLGGKITNMEAPSKA